VRVVCDACLSFVSMGVRERERGHACGGKGYVSRSLGGGLRYFYNKKVTAQRNRARVLVQRGFDRFCIVVEI